MFKFVSPETLEDTERSVFEMTGRIADLVGGLPSRVQSVKISETMRPQTGSFSEARGLWTGTEIIVKRSELVSVESYGSTLLHEIAHARSGETDITIGFEQELTSLLGMVASKALPRASTDTELLQDLIPERIPEIRAASRQQQAESRDPAPVEKPGLWVRLFGNPSR